MNRFGASIVSGNRVTPKACYLGVRAIRDSRTERLPSNKRLETSESVRVGTDENAASISSPCLVCLTAIGVVSRSECLFWNAHGLAASLADAMKEVVLIQRSARLMARLLTSLRGLNHRRDSTQTWGSSKRTAKRKQNARRIPRCLLAFRAPCSIAGNRFRE